MLDLNSGSTDEHTHSKKTNVAQWNFQFGKLRRNTLFRFMNAPVQFYGVHAGSVLCRFCVLDTGYAESSVTVFPQYSN